MSDWDAEEFEPEAPGSKAAVPVRTDKWDGEDEDDDIKDAWDAESDEEQKSESVDGPAESSIYQKKKKKPLAVRLAEKEEARLKQLQELEAQKEDDDYKNTPEGKLEEKLRAQKMAEEGDLELARELLGAKEEMADNSGINFKPQTKEDFKTLRNHIINVGDELLKKLKPLESSEHFFDFAAELIDGLCMKLNVATLKKVRNSAQAFESTKLKEEKLAKAKKGKAGGKATIKMETDRSMFGRGVDDGYNDMDDFM